MPSRRTVAMLLSALFLAAPASGATEAGGGGPIAAPAQPVHYQPPVSGRIVDAFRPPTTPYGPGNRGIDYLTTPGEPVRAAGPGTVTFAGQVGGPLVVVVLHADALRTSYLGLSGIEVKPGDVVAGG